MQAAMVVPRRIRSMVHAKVSLQGGSQPNSCTHKVAALRALIRRSSVCDQVCCLHDSARLYKRQVLVSSQCSQSCAVSYRFKLRLRPRAYCKLLSVGTTVITLHQGSAPRLTCTSDDGAVICCAQQPGPHDDLSARNRFGLQCSTPGGISVELTSDAEVSDFQMKPAHRQKYIQVTVTHDDHRYERHAEDRRIQPSLGHLHESRLVCNKQDWSCCKLELAWHIVTLADQYQCLHDWLFLQKPIFKLQHDELGPLHLLRSSWCLQRQQPQPYHQAGGWPPMEPLCRVVTLRLISRIAKSHGALCSAQEKSSKPSSELPRHLHQCQSHPKVLLQHVD